MINKKTTGKLNLLLIEDNPDDVRIIQEMLHDLPEFKLFNVNCVSSAIEYLNKNKTDLVLLDPGLPGTQGLDTVKMVVLHVPFLPVIVLTSIKDNELALDSIKIGAQDYLVKGRIDTDQLARSLYHSIERKHSEVALRESQENLKALIENTKDAIWSVDRHFRLITGNSAFHEHTGLYLRRRIASGENLLECGLTPEIREEWKNYFNRVLNGERFYVEKETHFSDKIRVFDFFFYPILDQIGNITGIVVSGRDITDRRKSEETLIKLQKAIDASVEVIFLTDIDGIFTFINPAFTALYGYTPDDVIGKVTPRILKGGTMKDEFYEQFWNVLLSGEEVKGEFINKTKEGRLIGVEGSITPVITEERKSIGYLGIQRDISQRKQAEERLMESEKKYRELFDGNLAGNFITTVTGEIQLCNAAFAQIFGFGSVEDALHFNVTGLYKSAEDRKQLIKLLKEKKKLELFEKEFIRIDGKKITVLLTEIGEFDENNELIRKKGYLLDITEHKQIQEEIKKLNEELERRVNERTLQLQVLNKELETFSYSVSHDLRAPLRAIDGYTQILFEDYEPKLDDEGKRLCGVIRDSTQHMGQLIDDLLAFSHLSRIEINISLIDMKKLAGFVYKELTSPEMRLRIDFQLDKLNTVSGDPILIQQIWVNLISNAIKFSSHRERTMIKISSKRRKNFVVYNVTDNGAGFDMKYIDKLFGVFQRLHSSKDFEGTGIGLAVVKHIIIRHGGEVWAEGEVGKGATFYFSLPLTNHH